MLIGNKADMQAQRQVEYPEAVQLAKQLGLAGIVETSAKEGSQSLDDAFFVTAANALDSKMASGNNRVLENPVKKMSRFSTNQQMVGSQT